MSLLNECRMFIEQNRLLDCDVAVVAVSGGPDSMCLLDLLLTIAGDSGTGPVITVAHLNHRLRGDASDADEELVRAYCERRTVPFFSRKTAVSEDAHAAGIGIEEAGRKARYAFFDEIAELYEPDSKRVRIAVAHRREDQAETMLINLFRGTGLDGLCAMEPNRGRVIRPILFASKDQVTEYMRERNIPFSVDQSNLENDYARNKWRNLVIPIIREVSVKDPIEALISAGELLRADKDFFDNLVSELFDHNQREIARGIPGIPCELLRGAHPAVASRLVRRLFLSTVGKTTDLSKEQVEKILVMASKKESNRFLSLSGGVSAGFQADILFFANRSKPTVSDDDSNGETGLMPSLKSEIYLGKEYLILDEGVRGIRTLGMSDVGRTVEVPSTKSGETLFRVELIAVENPAQVVYNNRTWYCPMDGIDRVTVRKSDLSDYVRPAGGRGGKPLRRYLTDRKVPIEFRKRMIVAAEENEVLWIPGLVHSRGFTDEISCGRYLAEKGLTSLFSSEEKLLCRITVIL